MVPPIIAPAKAGTHPSHPPLPPLYKELTKIPTKLPVDSTEVLGVMFPRCPGHIARKVAPKANRKYDPRR